MTWTARTMWRTCLHKKAYRTKDYALGIAKKIEEERERNKKEATATLGDISFNDNISDKKEVKKEKKMSRFELLQSLKK